MKGGEKGMTATERRQKIMELLNVRRQETMQNMAFEFGVSDRTIRNDINELSLSYPIETIRGRYGGGVRLMDGFSLNRKYLNPEQQNLLEKLSAHLSGDDLATMNSIFRDFALHY